MTENRFQVYKVIGSFHEWSIEDSFEDKVVFGSIMHKYNADRLCEKLNDLDKENRKLKNELNLSKLNLKEKNEGFDKLHKMYIEQIEENKELKKENEELGEEIELLEGKLWNCKHYR